MPSNFGEKSYFLKHKDPAYMFELIVTGYLYSPMNYQWIIGKPWPNETGIFEAPIANDSTNTYSFISSIIVKHGDLTDHFTAKVLQAVDNDRDPVDYWGAKQLYDNRDR